MSDKKYIISEFHEFKADKNLILEAEKSENGLITLVGILQKADTINRNGRIYPYEILKREAAKYMELVNGSMAYGETDHPSCLCPDTKILTKSGWKFIPDIAENEEILTLNTETNKIEIKTINEKIDQPYKGEMYHFKGRGIDQIVTPNHRFLLKGRSDNFFYKTAKELYVDKNNHWNIPKLGDWEGIEYDYITIPGLSIYETKLNAGVEFNEKITQDIKIEAEVFYAFLGIYLAEGFAHGSKSGNVDKRYKIGVCQKKEDVKQKIRELMAKMPFQVNEVESSKKDGLVQFQITDKRLHKYLLKLGNSYQKHIPEDIKQGSSRLLNILFEWFLMGDGRSVRKYYYKDDLETKKYSVFSTSEQMILDLQEVLIKTGRHGNITKNQPKDRFIYDRDVIEIEVEYEDGTIGLVKQEVKKKRLIKAENSKTQYNLNVSTTKGIYLNEEMGFLIEKIKNYDDRVYCVNVDNNNFYTMRNGKSHWTGNSAVVSLATTSHFVIDMWFEGTVLYGKVVLLDENPAGAILKGILKKGGVLGISSRGIGSVKNVGGNDIVQDDFELIAFDFVSSPSTPGAYMFKEGYKPGMTEIDASRIPAYKTQKINEINTILDKYKVLSENINNDFWKNL